MNFYKHHLGDYDGATVHLSWDEDMAYTRLIRVYYRLERPIPLALPETFRLVRAVTKAQKEAVTRVLGEFFVQTEDGWRNQRCDEEIAAYQAQAETNRRIAKERTVGQRSNDSFNETSTNRTTNRAPNHKPEPRTKNQEPEARTADSSLRSEPFALKGGAGAQKNAPPTGPVWAAYRAAYKARYGSEPAPNAEDNAHMLAFVKKIPADDAPEVAAFYVRHSKRWYVEKSHAVKYLREDAIGLHTQWLSGRVVTETEARQADRTQATGNAFAELISEAREREAKERALDQRNAA